jgi:hypothetical protein
VRQVKEDFRICKLLIIKFILGTFYLLLFFETPQVTPLHPIVGCNGVREKTDEKKN